MSTKYFDSILMLLASGGSVPLLNRRACPWGPNSDESELSALLGVIL